MFAKRGFFTVVELELQQNFLALLDPMQAGNGESQATPGNVVDVDEPAANTALAGDDIGTGKTDRFAKISAEIKQDVKDMLATAAD